jgi:hypothetical protein
VLSPATWGVGSSIVVASAAPSHAAVSAVAMASALDCSALSAGGFGTLFFGDMISTSDKHGGCQCCSRP